jgi:hypothetical protein
LSFHQSKKVREKFLVKFADVLSLTRRPVVVVDIRHKTLNRKTMNMSMLMKALDNPRIPERNKRMLRKNLANYDYIFCSLQQSQRNNFMQLVDETVARADKCEEPLKIPKKINDPELKKVLKDRSIPQSIKKRMKQSHVLFNLIWEKFMEQNGLCAYSDHPLQFDEGPFCVSVERHKIAKGFTKDNISLVLAVFNKPDRDNDVIAWTREKVQDMLEFQAEKRGIESANKDA